MIFGKRPLLGLVTLLLSSVVGFALPGNGGGGGGGGGRRFGGGGGGGGFAQARIKEIDEYQLPADRDGVPTWQVDSQFKKDVFTFVRLKYTNDANAGGVYANSWATDFPGSDLNFPFRLHQMTSMKVDPDSKRIAITDEALFDYPFVYMLEVSRLEFTPEEILVLRRYLLNGGFLMIDDHWGLKAQQNFREQIGRVFPGRPFDELPLEHPIFHCVFDLKAKPQIPGIENWERYHRSWEQPDDTEPHYRAMYDDKGRMMVLECANTDLGDGWEREGVNEEFFHMFSEKQAYPMGINIIFYALTH